MFVLWELINRNFWQVVGGAVDRHELSVNRLRRDLFSYYRSLPTEALRQITQLENLTYKILGKRVKPTLKTKAAETKAFVPFLCSCVNGIALSWEVSAHVSLRQGSAWFGFMRYWIRTGALCQTVLARSVGRRSVSWFPTHNWSDVAVVRG